jgi:HD-GYP domain-containing protein (c-di-GMP phosphodiesterase class II)
VRGVAGVSEIASIVESHEEWFDGTGYPKGLAEAEIPLESRIVACAVAYVGLSRLVGGSEAVRGLQRQAGSALDPEVVIAALAFLTRDSGHPARRMGDVRTT